MTTRTLIVIEEQLDLLAAAPLASQLRGQEVVLVLCGDSTCLGEDLAFLATTPWEIASDRSSPIDLGEDRTKARETFSALAGEYGGARSILFRPPGAALRHAMEGQAPVHRLRSAAIAGLLGQALPVALAEARRRVDLGRSFDTPVEGYILADVAKRGGWAGNRARLRLAGMLSAVAGRQDLDVAWSMSQRERRGLIMATPPGRLAILERGTITEWVNLLAHARLVVTDRLEVQIAACLLGVPCVTLAEHTSAPETIPAGANLLAGASLAEFQCCAAVMLRKVSRWASPYGKPDGPVTLSAAL